MRNKVPLILTIVVALILLGLFLLIKAYTPKYSWFEKLTIGNEEPYGISILYNLVKDKVPEKNFHELKNDNFDFVLDSKTRSTYVYVGTNFYIDSSNVQSLIRFVRKGNKAFIASTNHLENFMAIWQQDSTLSGLLNVTERDTVKTSFNSVDSASRTNFVFYHQFAKKTTPYPWPYLDSAFFTKYTSYQPQVLSELEGAKPNFVRMDLGRGSLYFHTTPLFLSNYHLVRKSTFNYLQIIWNEIAADEIIWDSFSSSPYSNTMFKTQRESPLRFILKNKSLRWAWFLLLFSTVIFVIFQSNRKQNIIALTEAKENNTLDYAKAIGSLYFQAQGHRAIAIEMMNQFENFVKFRYKMKLGKEKEKSSAKLSKLSGINRKILSEMFKLELNLKYDSNANSEQLYKLYNLVDNFYKNCD